MSQTRTRSEIEIDAPPERVFEAWADPDEITRWYLQRQVGDPRLDGRIVWFIRDEDQSGKGESLEVLTAEPGYRLRLENVGNSAWRGTILDVDFAPAGDGTYVVVAQSGFSQEVAGAAPIVESGWTCVLAVLKEYLEHHSGRPRHMAMASRDVRLDSSAVAEALESGGAIAEWIGERPKALLATTPHGAVVSLPGFSGAFTLMGAGMLPSSTPAGARPTCRPDA